MMMSSKYFKFNNKIRGSIVFFRNLRSNPSGLMYLFMVLVVPVFLIAFQNCKTTGLEHITFR